MGRGNHDAIDAQGGDILIDTLAVRGTTQVDGFAGKWLERSATGIRSQLLDNTEEPFLEYSKAKANETLPCGHHDT